MNHVRYYACGRRLTPRRCPHCGLASDECTGLARTREGTIPHDGMATVCVACGVLLTLAPDGLEPAPPELLERIGPEMRAV